MESKKLELWDMLHYLGEVVNDLYECTEQQEKAVEAFYDATLQLDNLRNYVRTKL